MGIAVGSEDEMEDMPISNPLPPPPRPQGKDRRDRDRSKEEAADRAENLSNADFRKMVMDTPRRGEEKQKERPRRYAYLVSPPCCGHCTRAYFLHGKRFRGKMPKLRNCSLSSFSCNGQW